MTTIVVTTDGGVATVTLNRPEVMNALNATMFDELEVAFVKLKDDASVRVIVVTGAGEKAFAAGADIRGLVETDAVSGKAVSERGQEVFRQIETCGKPVIAAVNGVALGGGCELAMACTFRIASEKAKMGLPEVKLGLLPGYGGTQRLVRLVGRGQAQRLMLTASVVEAGEALRLGLVEEVVAAESLMGRVTEVAATVAGLSPLGVQGVLEAVDRGSYEAEAEVFGRLCGTKDKYEGLTAFLEKRKAVWGGE
jgi:enoyl-CoA hydratase